MEKSTVTIQTNDNKEHLTNCLACGSRSHTAYVYTRTELNKIKKITIQESIQQTTSVESDMISVHFTKKNDEASFISAFPLFTHKRKKPQKKNVQNSNSE